MGKNRNFEAIRKIVARHAKNESDGAKLALKYKHIDLCDTLHKVSTQVTQIPAYTGVEVTRITADELQSDVKLSKAMKSDNISSAGKRTLENKWVSVRNAPKHFV